MTTLVLAGIPSSFLVLGIVQAAKEAGMPGRFSLLLSIFVGLLMGLASQYQLQPHDYITGAGLGIAAGLIASGVYSGVQSISQPKMNVLQGVATTLEPWQSSFGLPIPGAPAESKTVVEAPTEPAPVT